MKKFILGFVLILVCELSSAQATTAQLTRLNILHESYKQAELAGDQAKMAKLAEQIARTQQIYNTTAQIYQHYQNVVEAVETVSSLIRTLDEVREFYDDVVKISDLYSQYGVGYSFNSMYDFDEYLNPDEHDAFIKTMKKIYETSLEQVNEMALITTNKASGGTKATEFERLIEILEMHENIRTLLRQMERTVFIYTKLIPARNRNAKSNIELKKSFFNYKTYAH